MTKLYKAALEFLMDEQGQDLVEYALLAGSLSMTAGAFLPQWVGPTISMVFSKVNSCMSNAASF